LETRGVAIEMDKKKGGAEPKQVGAENGLVHRDPPGRETVGKENRMAAHAAS